jgi:hypothetical protein
MAKRKAVAGSLTPVVQHVCTPSPVAVDLPGGLQSLAGVRFKIIFIPSYFWFSAKFVLFEIGRTQAKKKIS